MTEEQGYSLGEMDRRLANILRYGTIAQIDEAGGLVKVDIGELVTDWLRWGEQRAGAGVRTWTPPEIGEQVMVFSPGGELSQGIVGYSIYQTLYPQNGSLKTKYRVDYADGAYLEYDRVGHHWHVDVPAAGSITLHIGGTTLLLQNGQATLTTPLLVVDAPQSTFTGNVLIEGGLTVEGTSVAQGDTQVQAITSRGVNISNTHTHGGITTGPDNTGAVSG